MHGYATRTARTSFVELYDHNELEAVSSVGPTSSPTTIPADVDSLPHIAFKHLDDLPSSDEESDMTYIPSPGLTHERHTNEEKAFEVLC